MATRDALAGRPPAKRIDVDGPKQLHEVGRTVGVAPLAVGAALRDKVAGIVQLGQ